MSDVSLVFNLVARDRTGETLDKVTAGFKKVGALAGAGAAAALGVGLAANLDASAANSKLAAQLGLGPAEAAKVSKVSANVYRNAWGESTADVDDAIKGVYMNIGDTKGAEGGLEGITTKVLALGDTFDHESSEITAAAGNMLKNGLAKNADEAMDLITVGFQGGADKAGDFLDTLNEYSPQFAKLKIDGPTAIKEINASLKAGARDSDLAADGIKEFYLRVGGGDSGAVQALKGLGLNAQDMTHKIAAGGPVGQKAMHQIFVALKSVKDPVKQNQLGAQLMGTQWEDLGPKAAFALDPVPGKLGKVKGATDKMMKSLNNPGAAFESFKRKAIGVFGDLAGKVVMFVADKIVPAITKLIDTFKDIGNWLMDHKPVLAGLVAMLGAIGAVIFIAMLPAMIAWVAATWASVTALFAQAAAMLAAYWPILLIIVGIGLLVAGIFWLIQNWTTVWNGIKAVISAVWGFIRDSIFAPIGRFFTQTIPRWAGMMKDALVSAWNTVKSKLLGAWNGLKSGLSAIGGFFTKTIPGWASTVRDRLVSAWTTAKSRVQSAVGTMVSWVKGKWNGFVDFFRGLPGRISRATSGMFNGIKSAFRSAVNFVISGWNNLSFHIGGGSILGHKLPSVTLNTPNIPYLAKGGIATRGGLAMVGEDGPELLSLPRGAGVTPLPVGGGSGSEVTVRIELTGPEEVKKFLRKIVTNDGGGSVQKTFGTG